MRLLEATVLQRVEIDLVSSCYLYIRVARAYVCCTVCRLQRVDQHGNQLWPWRRGDNVARTRLLRLRPAQAQVGWQH